MYTFLPLIFFSEVFNLEATFASPVSGIFFLASASLCPFLLSIDEIPLLMCGGEKWVKGMSDVTKGSGAVKWATDLSAETSAVSVGKGFSPVVGNGL